MGKEKKREKQRRRFSSRSPSRKRRHRRTYSPMRRTNTCTPGESESYSSSSSSSSSSSYSRSPTPKQKNQERFSRREHRRGATSTKRGNQHEYVDDWKSCECFQGARTENYQAHCNRDVQDSINVPVNSKSNSRQLETVAYMMPSATGAVSEFKHVRHFAQSNRMGHSRRSTPDLLIDTETSKRGNQQRESAVGPEASSSMLSFANVNHSHFVNSEQVTRNLEDTHPQSTESPHLPKNPVDDCVLLCDCFQGTKTEQYYQAHCNRDVQDSLNVPVNSKSNSRELETVAYMMTSATGAVSEFKHVRHFAQSNRMGHSRRSTPDLLIDTETSKRGNQQRESAVGPEASSSMLSFANVHNSHFVNSEQVTRNPEDTHPQSIESGNLPENPRSTLPSNTNSHQSNYALCTRNINVQLQDQHCPVSKVDKPWEDMFCSKPSGFCNNTVRPNRNYLICSETSCSVESPNVGRIRTSPVVFRGQQRLRINDNISDAIDSITSNAVVRQQHLPHPNPYLVQHTDESAANCTGTTAFASDKLTSSAGLQVQQALGVHGSSGSSITWVKENPYPYLSNSFIIRCTDRSIAHVVEQPDTCHAEHPEICYPSTAKNVNNDQDFSTPSPSDQKWDVPPNSDNPNCEESTGKSHSKAEVAKHEGVLNKASDDCQSDIDEDNDNESMSKAEQKSKLRAMRFGDDHIDDNDGSHPKTSCTGGTGDAHPEEHLRGPSKMTSEYKSCKREDKVAQIHNTVELNPIRRMFFAHEDNKIAYHKFKKLIQSTRMRKITIPRSESTLISCLLITLSEIGQNTTRENFCKSITSELTNNRSEYGQSLRNCVRLDSFKGMCEAYYQGRLLETEIDILYRVCANACRMNVNLISIDSGLKKHVLKTYDCARCTSTDNIFIFFSWRGNKESRMFPHHDCYVKDKYFQDNYQLINFIMINGDVTKSNKKYTSMSS